MWGAIRELVLIYVDGLREGWQAARLPLRLAGWLIVDAGREFLMHFDLNGRLDAWWGIVHGEPID